MRTNILMPLVLSLSLWPSSVADGVGPQRRWVLGNHSGHSAVELCAIGSPGCMEGEPEDIDVEKENAAAQARLLMLPQPQRIIIVPGDTPDLGWENKTLPTRFSAGQYARTGSAADELASADDYALILVSGGNVHPEQIHTPYNEAYQMKQALIREFNVSADRIIIDAYARHTTTNVRNAGRFMLAYGIRNATIVSQAPQTLYLSYPQLSFTARCKRELGYVVGELRPGHTDITTYFSAAAAVWTRDETEPRDP